MYLDFQNLNLDVLRRDFDQDEYFRSIVDFLSSFLEQEQFTTYTSGSTGDPKLLTIERSRAIESAKLSNEYFGISSTTQFLHCLDNRYIGAKMMLIRAYLAEAKVTVVKPSLDFYRFCNLRSIDFISLTPLHVHHILDAGVNFFESVGICLMGGSGVSPQLEQKIVSKMLSTKFYESFAMTETISHFALRNISTGESAFELLNGFEISVNANHQLEVYHRVILPKKIVTNDIVEISETNSFHFKGRMDHVINTGGLKISPESLERAWSLFLQFKFIIAGEADPIYGQRIIMILDSKTMISKEEIISVLKMNSIQPKFLPKEYYYANPWVETPNHKPIRQEIFNSRLLLH